MWTEITRRKHARKGLRYSSDLTDAEWAVLEPLLPARSRLGRPAKWSLLTIADALLYILRSGQPWRMLPRTFRRWCCQDGSAKPRNPLPSRVQATAAAQTDAASARKRRRVGLLIR